MSMNADFDRIARTWLQDGPTAVSDRSLQAALDEVHLTRQRRFGAARRAILLNGNAYRFAAAGIAAAVIVVAIAAFTLGRPVGDVGGPPTATPSSVPTSSPTPTPIPTPISLSSMTSGAAGTYAVPVSFAVDGITVTLGPGWRFVEARDSFVDLTIPEADRTPAWLIFNIVNEVYPDPCGAPGVPTATPLGPSVDDLVAALTNLKGYDASPVTDVTIGGRPAKSFVLTDAADSTCEGGTLIGIADTLSTNKQSIQRYVVLDVDGQRLLIGNVVLEGAAQEKAPDEYVSTIDAAIDTITFP